MGYDSPVRCIACYKTVDDHRRRGLGRVVVVQLVNVAAREKLRSVLLHRG